MTKEEFIKTYKRETIIECSRCKNKIKREEEICEEYFIGGESIRRSQYDSYITIRPINYVIYDDKEYCLKCMDRL